ncbi:vitamin K-dependent protein S [Trichonephila clavipes]|nr:vitamin K-dependent protein S [Trichonephila clavipes]
MDNFGCSDICSNTLGSAHCACPPGFELQEDQKTCSDIDECSLKNGGCDGICHNTVGNFSCSCWEGYVASVNDKYSCEDVDECKENNGDCSDKCINFKGGYHCTCPGGYHLHPDGKNCLAVHCPRVYVPHHSTLKCKNGLTTDQTDYKPGEMAEDAEFPVGTVCKVKCSKGYELNSDLAIFCRNSGHWNATPPECRVLQCPPLNPPDNGDVYPRSCKEGPMAVKEKCVFTCLPGFRITGQEVITCKNKLEWDFKKTTVCVPGFGNDSKIVVMGVDVTAHVTPELQCRMRNRYLAVTSKRSRRSTASDLSRQLSSATGTIVSRQTVYRRLEHIGLYARRPVRCVPLTAPHCRLRLTWSREHALWTPQQWSYVIFFDESRFSLESDSRRPLIWRASGTRYHQENTIERHRYGGAGGLAFGEKLFLVPELTCTFRM